MRSRAVRRLQEPARWVPAALNAMLFTPWSPLLNLPGRHRLQRPTYEEPIEAGTLPRFIEIPTAPTTKHPKTETFVTKSGDAEQSTERQRQEVTFREPQQTSSSSGAVADTSMQIPDPQIPKPARQLSPAEREDSIQKRQRPAEMNTVLAFAGGDSRIEISTLTKDHKALHNAKVNELRNMDNFGVVEAVDRPQSQQVLSTRWVSKQRLDGSYKVRLVARGFEQTISSDTDFDAGTPKLTTLRALLTIAAIHGNPVAFGDCHSAVHQSPVPIEPEPVYVEPAPEAQLDSSKVWLCKKAFQGLEISPQAWGIHSTQTINDMSYNQLISDPSTCVKKRAHALR